MLEITYELIMSNELYEKFIFSCNYYNIDYTKFETVKDVDGVVIYIKNTSMEENRDFELYFDRIKGYLNLSDMGVRQSSTKGYVETYIESGFNPYQE